MTDHNTNTKVVVVGGGYAGTLAANRLRMRRDVDITLINPRPRFVQRLRLHQLVAGTGDATADYGTLLGAGIRLVVDTAARIDSTTRKVQLASGSPLDYDYVIYAVGSTGALPATVPGAAEFAYSVAEFEHALQLRDALDNMDPDAPVTVVGGGLTGIEAATELAEQGRKVTLVCGGQLAPSLSGPGRRSIAKVLAKLRVALLEAEVVTEVRPDAVVFADGAVRPSAVTIWAAGFGVPGLAADSGLRTDALGRLLTDETLTSVDDQRIIAAGDCAAPSGQPLRMCCASASPLGIQAANTVLSRIAGTAPAVIDLALVGSCISLGRRSGILQFARKDDTAVNFYIGSRLVAKIKEAVVKGTLWGIRREARKPGVTVWLKGGPRPSLPVLEPAVVTES
jgi:NADH:quinone reductase (non-electrogenic)